MSWIGWAVIAAMIGIAALDWFIIAATWERWERPGDNETAKNDEE